MWHHVLKISISVTGIENTHTIFGLNISSLCVKTVIKNTKIVMSDYVVIPRQIKDKTKRIEINVDVMFVNNIPFMISLG